jgi:hypothetical protein
MSMGGTDPAKAQPSAARVRPRGPGLREVAHDAVEVSLLAAAELGAHRERLAEHLAGIDAAVSREQPKLEDVGHAQRLRARERHKQQHPLGEGPRDRGVERTMTIRPADPRTRCWCPSPIATGLRPRT